MAILSFGTSVETRPIKPSEQHRCLHQFSVPSPEEQPTCSAETQRNSLTITKTSIGKILVFHLHRLLPHSKTMRSTPQPVTTTASVRT